jgi:hypothetical protein
MAKSLDAFFKAVPEDKRYHVELRTDAYLADPVFDVLEKHGVGLVYSHWTWLPPLSKQLSKTRERFFNSGGDCITRLMTPLRMSYEDSYAKAFPFDKMVEGMMNPEMIDDAIEIIREGIRQRKRMSLIINNKARGNAPIITRQIAKRLQEGINIIAVQDRFKVYNHPSESLRFWTRFLLFEVQVPPKRCCPN